MGIQKDNLEVIVELTLMKSCIINAMDRNDMWKMHLKTVTRDSEELDSVLLILSFLSLHKSDR